MAPDKKYHGLRVTPAAYDAFTEFLMGLEMTKPPRDRICLTLRTKTSEALAALLESPWAKEIRAKAPRARRPL